MTMWKKVAARYRELKQVPPPDRSSATGEHE